jgi:hypothetical protein
MKNQPDDGDERSDAVKKVLHTLPNFFTVWGNIGISVLLILIFVFINQFKSAKSTTILVKVDKVEQINGQFSIVHLLDEQNVKAHFIKKGSAILIVPILKETNFKNLSLDVKIIDVVSLNNEKTNYSVIIKDKTGEFILFKKGMFAKLQVQNGETHPVNLLFNFRDNK